MTSQCKDCRWWKQVPRDETIFSADMGDCSRLDHSLMIRIGDAEAPDGLRPHRIVTRSSFGCVEFETKE